MEHTAPDATGVEVVGGRLLDALITGVATSRRCQSSWPISHNRRAPPFCHRSVRASQREGPAQRAMKRPRPREAPEERRTRHPAELRASEGGPASSGTKGGRRRKARERRCTRARVRGHVMIAHSAKGDVFGMTQRASISTYVIDVELPGAPSSMPTVWWSTSVGHPGAAPDSRRPELSESR